MKIKPLTPRQANALQMTLDGHTKNSICDKLGITQKTLWTWRRLPAWDETISVALKESSGGGQNQIKTMLPLATRRLRHLIFSQNEGVALGACRTVLEAHANLVQREEQIEMMGELEARLNELQEVARNQGLMAVQSGVPVIDADTQELAAADDDRDLGQSNGPDVQQSGDLDRAGHGLDTEQASNTTNQPHAYGEGEG